MLICLIDDLLEEEGRKKTWLSEKIGVTKQQMHNWCSNKSLPSLKYVYDIIQVTGWSFDDMFEELHLFIDIPKGDAINEKLSEFLDELVFANTLTAKYSELPTRAKKDELNIDEAIVAVYNHFDLKGKVEMETMVEDIEQLTFQEISKDEFIKRMETYKEKGFVQFD